MNILIIENSSTLSQLLSKTLSAYGYNVTLDNKDFNNKRLVDKKMFDIFLISTNLEKGVTQDLLKYIIEKSSQSKILGICNKGSWIEKVEFLKKGGDDVLTYPFPIQELLARIQSLMRRPKNYLDENIYIGDFVLDLQEKTIYKDDKDLEIRKKEYELFEYLVRNEGRTVSRCELLDHVWDYRQYVGSNTVDVHINRLRDKLEDKEIIKTVHGIGYQLNNSKLKHHRHN
ncbi:MAG: response regulator transcription factor [Candidatus Dojkabacteria bacterium]|jgi:DNA-binding response OmpR family regulator|nr:response regulator transcription factor [Candidatus Dojkabacteria bacterium]NLB12274.1 response regulator transcription factor [Candidatus Dojkabacteria bacterium]